MSPAGNFNQMYLPESRFARRVPPRVLVPSLAALAVPVVGALAFPDALGELGALLWLVALVPVLVLAFYRGIGGAALALALGMATLSVTQLLAWWLDRTVPVILPGAVAAYLAIALGIGWVVEILHRHRDKVEDLAFTDLLTGLPNRRHARFVLENEFAAAERGRVLSVILFDLDHFKEYNDTYGHQAGDEALELFAEVLLRTTRRMNLSARFGGEEFLTVLAGSDVEGAFSFAERVRTALRARSLGSPPLTVSAGVAEYQSVMGSPSELLAAADRALYEAKGAGRNCVRVSGHPDFHEHRSTGSPPPPEGETPRQEGEAREGAPEAVLAPIAVLRAAASGLAGEGRRVLIVEDDVQVRKLIATFLSRDGFHVVECADVASGLTQLGAEFDVVVSDIQLPGTNGHRLVAAVKQRWPMTQVIVATALQDSKVATDALNAGADRYLFKPFGMPELRAALSDVLAHRDRLFAERLRIASSGSAALGGDEALKGARALVRALELRDPSTRGQAVQVADIARTIADAVDPEARLLDRDSLQLACELYDVGKIAISEAILNKEGRLTPEELREVRQHPATGRRMLEPFLHDETVLAAAQWHHEWWNGSGYPDGLAGADIPLVARVLALAEALAAMTRPRPYRGALDWNDALGELRALSGKQFDPKLVKVLDGWEIGRRARRPPHPLPGGTTLRSVGEPR